MGTDWVGDWVKKFTQPLNEEFACCLKTKYVFGVTWIENVTTENDVQTWYGADPTLF